MHRVRALLALAAATLAIAPAPAAPEAPLYDKFPYGVAWYPEQVSESEWTADLDRMRSAHITYVRMAEFAWSRIEPSEGRYDFGWLDRAIALAEARGLKVLLGTPTAAPPAWLTQRYPEVLLVEADGRRARHGGRRHASVSSALYRRKAAEIAARIAERYGRHPAVLGFQIDNEYGRETFDPAMRAAFQRWLRDRYGTLDALNAAWGTQVWSQTYSDWSQLDFPDGGSNPSIYLDYKRFFTDMWRDYQRNQIAAMRPHLGPGKFLTTNFVAEFDDFDYSLPARDLDLVGWDWYSQGQRLDPAEGALLHAMYRGFTGRNSWILETSAGNIVFVERNFTQRKGEVRAMAWQAVAHGADGYAYWVWRSPAGGVEQYHGSLVDAGGRPRPVLDEVAQAGAEIARAWVRLRGGKPVAEAALLHDYPSRWAANRKKLTADYDAWKLTVDFYRATAPAVGGVDVLGTTAGLSRYRLVVAPNLHVLSAEGARDLERYVRAGGHLVLGPRAGVKTPINLLWPINPLEELIGARVDQTQVLSAPLMLTGPGGSAKAQVWAERLTPGTDVEVLLRYAPLDGWLDGAPGVVTRRVGKGRVTYVGAWLDRPSLKAMLRRAAEAAGARPLLEVPDGVDVAAREGPAGRVTVAINWSEDLQDLSLPAPMRDEISGRTGTRLSLSPRGLAVLSDAR